MHEAITVCGIEMGIRDFKAKHNELYAVVCEGTDALSAVEETYSFLWEVGLCDVASAHFFYQRDLLQSTLQDTMEKTTLLNDSTDAALVLPGLSTFGKDPMNESDILAHVYLLRSQLDAASIPCFIPIHTKNLPCKLDALKRSLEIVGFSVAEIKEDASISKESLKSDAFDGAISMLDFESMLIELFKDGSAK